MMMMMMLVVMTMAMVITIVVMMAMMLIRMIMMVSTMEEEEDMGGRGKDGSTHDPKTKGTHVRCGNSLSETRRQTTLLTFDVAA